MRKSLMIVMLTLGSLGLVVVHQATAQGRNGRSQPTVSQQGNITILTIPSTRAQASAQSIDFMNAKPMPLSQAPSSVAAEAQADMVDALTSRASQASLGAPGYSTGFPGSGVMNPVMLGVPTSSANVATGVTPEEFGISNHPFTTSQIDLGATATNTLWPYRAAGKLFFNIGTSTYVCSASLIKRGIVVTAGHCVANYGHLQFYSNWQFVPAYRNGVAPYGTWTAAEVRINTAYYNGTDGCAVYGVVCPDDVALITLTPQAGAYAGSTTGWFGYGYDGYGFTSGGQTQITQLGYPVCLDSGQYMERNDSYGYVAASNANNTVIGSLMCGGSSGGPWVVNFGKVPTLTGTSAGTYSAHQIVVGVTSWGYIDLSIKEQGASPFTTSNISTLVTNACAAIPAAC